MKGGWINLLPALHPKLTSLGRCSLQVLSARLYRLYRILGMKNETYRVPHRTHEHDTSAMRRDFILARAYHGLNRKRNINNPR